MANSSIGYILRLLLTLAFSAAVITAQKARKAKPPQNLALVEATATSITLSWDAPDLSGREKLKGYQLGYRSADERKDKKVNLRKNEDTYTLEDLAEGTTYVFYVKAKTQDGTGLPTDDLEVSTLGGGGGGGLPDPPQYFEVLVTGASLYARWLPPEEGVFDAYLLSIGPSSSPGQEDVELDSAEQSYTFENLEAGVEYVLSLRTINDVGQSQVVMQRAFIESQTPPPPQSFTVTSSATSIEASWSPGEEDIRNYVVGIGVDELEEETAEVNWDQTSHVFHGLTPNTLYLVSVRAANENGPGEATTEKVTTDELSAPEPPQVVDIETTPDSITVRWERDSSVTGYEINLDPLGTESLDGSTTSHTFTGLDADTDYVLRLRAINDIGTSSPTEQLVATDRIGNPSAPVITSLVATANSVTVEWQSIESGITRFDITLAGIDRTAVGPEITTHTFTGLDPSTEYTVEVRALNPGGPSDWTSQRIYTEPLNTPAAPVIVSDSSTADSITINWQPMDDILSFEVTLEGEPPVPLNPFETSYTFINLEPDTIYSISLRVTNEDGISPPATETLSTGQLSPLARPTIRSADATANTIQLRWERPQDPITNFEITLVGTDPIILPAQETAYTFQNLQPDTRYTIELRVYNDGGPSNPARSRVTTDALPVDEEPEPEVHTGEYKVRNFEADIQGQTVILRWDPPTLQEDETLLGYLLKIDAEEISLSTSLRLHYRQNSYTFRNLEPLVTFHAILEPIRRELPVAPSDVTFTTYVSRFVPPRIQSVEILSSSAARVVWLDPTVSPVTGITDSRYYTLRYRPTQGSPNFLLANTRDFEYTVGDLIPDTEYEFAVQTVLEGVLSGFGEVVRNSTLSETDGQAPRLLTVVQLMLEFPNFIHATLNWLPPLERTAEVSGYNVQYSLVTEPTELDFKNLPVEGPVLAATVPRLTTNVTASFRVQAFFFSGIPLGPFSPVISFITPISAQGGVEEGNCESEIATITERITSTRERGGGVPPLGVPLPYCDEYLSQYACPWPTLVCTCLPRGTNVVAAVPNAKPNPGCGAIAEEPSCRRLYNRISGALKEARQSGAVLLGASLPYCKEDGYFQAKQCAGSLCYCVDRDGIPTGQEAPIWEAGSLDCRN